MKTSHSDSSISSSDAQALVKNSSSVPGHRRTPSGLFSRWRRNRATSAIFVGLAIFVCFSFWSFRSDDADTWQKKITFEKCPYSGDAIPRRLHQMWKNNTIPLKWQQSQIACKTFNKNYEYFLWTDEKMLAFLTKHYSWFLPTYHSYRFPIQRVDAVRYFILYHYGGIYVDLDLQCKFPFVDIIEKLRKKAIEKGKASTFRVVLAETLPDGVTNAVMMTNPCSPFFKELITSLSSSNRWYILPYPTVIFSTGPMFLTIELGKYEARQTDVYRFSNQEFRHEYFIHKIGSSWHSWDGKLIHVLDHWSEIVAVIVIPLIIIIFALILVYYRRNKKVFQT